VRRDVRADRPGGQPDPTIIATEPAPDFFFLWIFAALALLPANVETPLLLTAPVIGIGVLWRCRSCPARARRAGGAAGVRARRG
jgi:hypothetical protein